MTAIRSIYGLCWALALTSPLLAQVTTKVVDGPNAQIVGLPSAETVKAIEALSIDPSATLSGDSEIFVGLQSGVVPAAESAPIGMIAPTSIYIQVKPNATSDEIEGLIKDNKLSVVETLPKIGWIKVISNQPLWSQSNRPGSPSIEVDSVLTGIDILKSDQRIVNATPNVIFGVQNIVPFSSSTTSVVRPKSAAPMMREEEDWGIGDIEANALWGEPGARDGVTMGVLDAGFARHEDLVFQGLGPNNAPSRQNHGNHVAGIACAAHNGVGVKGVLPNCFIKGIKETRVPLFVDGTNLDNFVVNFGQIVSTMYQFIDDEDSIETYNVSLGYNWAAYYSLKKVDLNITAPENFEDQKLVATAGQFASSALQLAAKNNKFVFLAAGNDSKGGAIDSEFASPFTWAQRQNERMGFPSGGVIVAAHDKQGKRADFSNTGAHLSCPGQEILSPIAFDAVSNPSNNDYGWSSGTSMAAPYCAAGFQLLRLVRPGYSPRELLNCMLQSTAKTDAGTPMLKLTQAIAACPPKS